MAKLAKNNKVNKPIKPNKNRLHKTAKGRVEKPPKKSKKSQIKSNKHDEFDDDSSSIKKKPSKAELKSVLEALKKDPELIMVRKALKYMPFYLKSEGLIKKLSKEIIRLWAEANEKVRVVCLLCLIRLFTKIKDKERKEDLMKKLYTTFLDKCRITKHDTMSMIGFMRHSLVQLYTLDSKIALKQAQSLSQQLTTTLKNAQTHKNAETAKTVLSWQYVNCLVLLSNIVTSQDQDSPLRALTNEVIALNLGAINLLMSPRYYPFYCHIMENLIDLSSTTDTFIPLLPMMVGIMCRLNFPHESKKPAPEQKQNGHAKKPAMSDDDEDDDDDDDDNNDDDENVDEDDKEESDNSEPQDDDEDENDDDEDSEDEDDDEDSESESSDEDVKKKNAKDKKKSNSGIEKKKEYNINLLNHVTYDEAHSIEFETAVLSKLHELMVRYLASQCNKIAFPELVFLPAVQVKKWLKKNTGQPSQIIKSLWDKVKSDAEKVTEARKSVTFEFSNYAAVDAWQKKMKDSNKLVLLRMASTNCSSQ